MKTITLDRPLGREKCICFFMRYGYHIHEEDAVTLVLKRPGTTCTWSIAKMPLELSISFRETGTDLSLRYDMPVLWGADDLQKELQRLTSLATANMESV